MSWELSVLTTLILSACGSWWFFSPLSRYQQVFTALVAVLTLLADPRRLLQHWAAFAYDAFHDVRLDVLLTLHFRMAMTLGALAW
jgi:hypothetical protein